MKDLLACPMCHAALDDMACTPCGLEFKINHGVPSFICRAMYPSDDAYKSANKIIEFWGKGWEKRLAEPDHKPLFESDGPALERYAEDDLKSHRMSDSVLGTDLPIELLRGKTVVNIGAGAGTEALVLSYSGASCLAIDITSQAANAAQTLMSRVGASGIGVQADARYIPLRDNSVDFVYSSGVLHHSPDIARSISEVHRILKPGGKAFVMLYATWSILFMQMRLMFSPGETAWETVGRRNPHTTTYTKRECERLFSQFSNLSVRKTGASLGHLALIGRWLPTRFDRFLDQYLGARLNIVATKGLA